MTNIKRNIKTHVVWQGGVCLRLHPDEVAETINNLTCAGASFTFVNDAPFPWVGIIITNPGALKRQRIS